MVSNQLLRSGTSIGANIEEGRGGHSKADFIAKYAIACKEAREAHYWLRLIAATNLTKVADVERLTVEANELIAILTTIIKNARQQGERLPPR